MDALTPAVVVICYGIAWEMSSRQPILGLLFLAAIGTLISLPRTFMVILRGMLISTLVGILILFMPFLAPLVFLVPLFMVLRSLGMNWSLIIFSFCFYTILLFVPSSIRTSMTPMFGATDSSLLIGLEFASGAAIMHAGIMLFDKMGYAKPRTAQFVLGFIAFLFVIALPFIKGSGQAGDMNGADGNGHH